MVFLLSLGREINYQLNMFSFLRRAHPSYTRLEHADPAHKDFFVVNWCLGNTCNYSCSYCPESLHNGSKDWIDLESIKSFVSQVQRHYGKKWRYYFVFTGGEITLYRDFIPMLEHLHERNCKVGIISNGSRSLDFWQKIRPLLDHVCLSFHPESAKADHFFAVAKLLSESVRVHLNFMMTPEHFYECYELAVKAKEMPNISIALQPLLVEFSNQMYRYTDTQKKIFDEQDALIVKHIKRTRTLESYRGRMAMVKKTGERTLRSAHQFISARENRWDGWRCHIGLEQLVVNMDGKIYRGWCAEGGEIGHVADAKIKFPRKPVLCARDHCHCNFDITATKEFR